MLWRNSYDEPLYAKIEPHEYQRVIYTYTGKTASRHQVEVEVAGLAHMHTFHEVLQSFAISKNFLINWIIIRTASVIFSYG